MDLVSQLMQKAKGSKGSVVLPEGSDDRILTAARRLKDEGIADPIVLGTPEQIQEAAQKAGVSADGIETHNPKDSPMIGLYAQAYAQKRGVDIKIATRMVKKPLFFGGMMVASGDAHTMVGGVASATASVIQSGALTVGYAPGINTASSFFLMVIPDFQGQKDKPFIYADCAVNIDPTAEELADIALASEASAAKLLGEQPRVAMLSFSTRASAAHPHVDKVTEALKIVKERNPSAVVDGEFQADAAILKRVADKKVKDGSDVAGQANVLIFPDLDAGNIGYKLTQYMANAKAIGPFLQGFAKPISDLSRGASADDVVATSAITLAQA